MLFVFFNSCFWPYQSVQIIPDACCMELSFFSVRDYISTFCIGLFHFQSGRLLLRSNFWWFSLNPRCCFVSQLAAEVICISICTYTFYLLQCSDCMASGTVVTVFCTGICAISYSNFRSQLLGVHSLTNAICVKYEVPLNINFRDLLIFSLFVFVFCICSDHQHRWLSLTRIGAVTALDVRKSLCVCSSVGCISCICILYFQLSLTAAVSHCDCWLGAKSLCLQLRRFSHRSKSWCLFPEDYRIILSCRRSGTSSTPLKSD